MRYRRAIVPGATYFFTLVTFERAPIFASAKNADLWHRAMTRIQTKRPVTVEAEVILPDHIHMIWSLPEGDANYQTRIRLAKAAFTKELAMPRGRTIANESLASKGERDVWQRRYWEHVIRDNRDFTAHVDYIHFNPVKHGFVAHPKDWPHSTFGDWVVRGEYDGGWRADRVPQLRDEIGRE